jgi:hypothetical protein
MEIVGRCYSLKDFVTPELLQACVETLLHHLPESGHIRRAKKSPDELFAAVSRMILFRTVD